MGTFLLPEEVTNFSRQYFKMATLPLASCCCCWQTYRQYWEEFQYWEGLCEVALAIPLP